MIGKHIAHYEVSARLGAGGMGEVYRARDTKLGREVALKLLPASATEDAQARARLVNEARTASSLNHPCICTIYEVGEADGQTYVGMELVAGKPLSQMIPPDGLPLESVTRYGLQIADALAHAHEHGIIHRDLKTSNVMITSEGRAKVLDFGLAKQLREEQMAEATKSKVSLTQAGAIVGTLHAIAPEILRGQPSDARSDIWALGVMLYEMASGALPFQGKTGFEMTSAILRESPGPLPERVPAGLRAIVQRCLAKEPGQRYQRASEVRAALEAIASGSSATMEVAPSRKVVVPWWRSPAALVFLAIGTLVALAISKGPQLIGIVEPDLPSATGTSKNSESGHAKLSTGGKPSGNSEANDYFERGMLYLLARLDLPRARQMLEKTLALDPHFAEARGWYGLTDLLMIDTGTSNDVAWIYKAEEELKRALQDDPECARVHSALAAVYFYEAKYEQVWNEARRAQQINPSDLDADNWLTGTEQLSGASKVAETRAKKQLVQVSTFFPARMTLGDILRDQGDFPGAFRELEKVLEQDSENVYALAYLARAQMEAGHLNDAQKTLTRVSNEQRQNFQVRIMWALLLALERKRAEALRAMDSETQKFASIAPMYTSMAAEFYAVLGDTEKSLEWLDRALRNGEGRSEWIQRNPHFSSLRGNPRFQQILQSIAFRWQQRDSSNK